MKKYLGIIICVVLCLFTVTPLLGRGFYPMHDDAQVARVVVMSHALERGQFPVRWVNDLGYGYGYPIFNFYGPLPYYVGGFLNLLGIDSLWATKIMIIAGVVIGGIGSYLLGAYTISVFGGIIASALFSFAPYRAIQLYVRGAIGELWALSFIPLFILGIFLTFNKRRQLMGFGLTILGLSGVILSHTVFGYLSVLFLALTLGLYWFVRWRLHTFIKSLFVIQTVSLMLTMFLTAFFWLPSLKEMRYTDILSAIGPSANYQDHFVCIRQLWNSPWGFGGSAKGCIDGMSFKLGKLHVILMIFSLAFISYAGIVKHRIKKIIPIMIFGVILTTVSLILTQHFSILFWNILPYAPFIQYPWRFLGFAIIGISILGSLFIIYIPKVFQIFAFTLIICGVILLNGKLFVPQYIYDKSISQFESKEDLQYRASKVSDEYLPKGIIKPDDNNDLVLSRIQPENAKVAILRENETYGKYIIEGSYRQNVVICVAAFPGWRYFINGKETFPTIEHGVPNVIVSEGSTELEIRFTDTPIRTAANILSLVTCIGLALFYVKKTIR